MSLVEGDLIAHNLLILAYEKGLHIKNVNYCCPPVVMAIYEK